MNIYQEYYNRIFNYNVVKLTTNEELIYGKFNQTTKNYFIHRQIKLMFGLILGFINLIDICISRPKISTSSVLQSIIAFKILLEIMKFLTVGFMIFKRDPKLIFKLAVFSLFIFSAQIIFVPVPFITYKRVLDDIDYHPENLLDSWNDTIRMYLWTNRDIFNMLIMIGIFRASAYDCYQRYEDKNANFLVGMLNAIYFPYLILVFAFLLNIVEFVDFVNTFYVIYNVELIRTGIIVLGVLFFIQFILRPFKQCLIVADILYYIFIVSIATILYKIDYDAFDLYMKIYLDFTYDRLILGIITRDLIFTWNLEDKYVAQEIMIVREQSSELVTIKNEE